MQFKHFCLPSEMTLILMPTSCFPVSHLLPFSSLSKLKTPLLSPSTSAYHLFSIFMSLRKKQPLAVNWPISHISFLKVEAGGDEWGGENLLGQHIGRTVNSLVFLGSWNKRMRDFSTKSARNCLLAVLHFTVSPSAYVHKHLIYEMKQKQAVNTEHCAAHHAQWFPKWRKISGRFHYSANV